MYVDPSDLGSPMETDGPMMEDVNILKKTIAEEATQVLCVGGAGGLACNSSDVLHAVSALN